MLNVLGYSEFEFNHILVNCNPSSLQRSRPVLKLSLDAGLLYNAGVDASLFQYSKHSSPLLLKIGLECLMCSHLPKFRCQRQAQIMCVHATI